MSEHPHAAIVRRGYEAFANGDIAKLTELIASDAVWHSPGKNPISGTYRGIEAILRYFMKFSELSSGQFYAELLDVLASDQHVVVLTRDTATRKGIKRSWEGGVIFQIQDSKLQEAWAFNLDQYAVDEFWS